MGLSFLASSLAFAFGGGGGGGTASPSARYKGVDSFGAHFGGSGQVEIEFTDCNDDKTSADYGLCTCLDPNAKYLIDAKKCVCKGGWKQEGKNCVFTCSGKEVDRCLEYDENCACISCQSGFSVVSGICAFTPNFSGNLTPPYENCLTFSNGTCTQCENGYYLQDTECVTSCSAGYYTKGTSCVQDCGVGYKVDGSACVACGTADINQKCGCGENKVWNGEKCVCKQGYFGSNCYSCDYNFNLNIPRDVTKEQCAACNYQNSSHPREIITNSYGEEFCAFTCAKGELRVVPSLTGIGQCISCLRNEYISAALDFSTGLSPEEECNKCTIDGVPLRELVLSRHYYSSSDSSYLVCARKTCDDGWFKNDYWQNCIECSDFSSDYESDYFATKEQCNRCLNREWFESGDGKGYCVASCPPGTFRTDWNTCTPCSENISFSMSELNASHCKKCNDTGYPRTIMTGLNSPNNEATFCARTTCDTNYFRSKDMSCISCSTTGPITTLTEQDCLLCNYEGAPYPRDTYQTSLSDNYYCNPKCEDGTFRGFGSNYCFSCNNTTHFMATPTSCANCSNREMITLKSDGNTVCALKCKTGEFRNESDTCQSCSGLATHYKDAQGNCLPCPENATCSGGTDFTCNVGFAETEDGKACEACNAENTAAGRCRCGGKRPNVYECPTDYFCNYEYGAEGTCQSLAYTTLYNNGIPYALVSQEKMSGESIPIFCSELNDQQGIETDEAMEGSYFCGDESDFCDNGTTLTGFSGLAWTYNQDFVTLTDGGQTKVEAYTGDFLNDKHHAICSLYEVNWIRGCIDYAADGKSCARCHASRPLKDGKCVTDCGIGYKTVNGVCTVCAPYEKGENNNFCWCPSSVPDGEGFCMMPSAEYEYFLDDNYELQYCGSDAAITPLNEAQCLRCNKSYPREMVNGQCVLKTTCGEGFFLDESGNCISCQYTGYVQNVSPEACKKCDNTSSPRIMDRWCQLRTCPEGYFRGSQDGECLSCHNISYTTAWTEKEEECNCPDVREYDPTTQECKLIQQ